MRRRVSLFAAGAARRINCCNGTKGEKGSLVVPQFEFLLPTEAVL
jgi:hypothetical protein